MIVLAIPDGAPDGAADGAAEGAADPTGDRDVGGRGASCLDDAATPCLDGLAEVGTVFRVRTIPPGLAAGTEVGVPTLLGVPLAAAPARGRLEAAAAGLSVAWDEGVWRLDVQPPADVDGQTLARLDRAVAPLGGRVHRLRGHRLLLVGPASWGDGPPGPHHTSRPLRDVAAGPFAAIADAAAGVLSPLAAWPWGLLGEPRCWPRLPAPLRRRVILVTPGGVVSGIGRLLGCAVVETAPGAGAEVAAGAPDGAVVVVHDPAPDEAGHARDRARKVAALTRFDLEVVGPLAEIIRRRGGRLLVCPDHACDPATGRHGGAPVPALVWAPGAACARVAGPRRPGSPRRARPPQRPPRLSERTVAAKPAVPAVQLLAEQLRLAEAAA